MNTFVHNFHLIRMHHFGRRSFKRYPTGGVRNSPAENSFENKPFDVAGTQRFDQSANLDIQSWLEYTKSHLAIDGHRKAALRCIN